MLLVIFYPSRKKHCTAMANLYCSSSTSLSCHPFNFFLHPLCYYSLSSYSPVFLFINPVVLFLLHEDFTTFLFPDPVLHLSTRLMLSFYLLLLILLNNGSQLFSCFFPIFSPHHTFMLPQVSGSPLFFTVPSFIPYS